MGNFFKSLGICNNRHYPCDSEPENLFREALISYRLLTKHSIESILSEFQNLPKAEEKGHEREFTYSSKAYEKLLYNFVDPDSEYYDFHDAIPIEFDNLFDSYKEEKPEYNFLLFAVGFLNDENKCSSIKKIYSFTDLDPETFTYQEFATFLHDYFTEIFENMTKRLNNIVQNAPVTKNFPGNRLNGETFKKQSNEVLAFYSNKKYYEILIQNVLKSMKKVMKKEKFSSKDLANEILSLENLTDLNSYHPYLFDILEMRHHYWRIFEFTTEDKPMSKPVVKSGVNPTTTTNNNTTTTTTTTTTTDKPTSTKIIPQTEIKLNQNVEVKVNNDTVGTVEPVVENKDLNHK